jgi:tetratricopeptide (TPR) repeat protein
MAARTAVELQQSGVSSALDRLQREHENLLAALDGATSCGDVALGLRVAIALSRFWQVRGYLTEGRKRLRQLLSLDGSRQPRLRAQALIWLGTLTQDQGNVSGSRQFFEDALALAEHQGERAEIASALYLLGTVAKDLQDPATARTYFERSLAMGRELNDPGQTASSLNALGNLAMTLGDYTAAEEWHRESLQLREQENDRPGIANSWNSIGLVARQRKEYEAAAKAFGKSLNLYRQIGDKRGVNISVHNLGMTLYRLGQIEGAQACEEEALRLSREIGHRSWDAANLYRLGDLAAEQGDLDSARSRYQESLRLLSQIDNPEVCVCLEGLAGVAWLQQQFERAARFLGAADAVRAEAPPSFSHKRGYDARHIAAARAGLKAEALASAYQLGWSMGHAAIDAALNWRGVTESE